MKKYIINYQKKWDSKGTCYIQQINITEKELFKIQKKHLKEFKKLKEIKKNERLESSTDWYYRTFLGSHIDCERLGSVVFTNLTQRDFFIKILNIKQKILNRNTCFIIN